MTAERSRSSHEKDHQMAQTDEFDAPEALLTPSEVAALFRVNPKTVTRWARAGKLTAIRTLGGHRRFPGFRDPSLSRGDVPRRGLTPRGVLERFLARSSGRGGLVRATLRVWCRGLVRLALQPHDGFCRYGVTTTKSIDASHTTRPSSFAMPEPRPAVALSRSIRVSSTSVSPGPTCARKRALSMPPNKGNLPA